MVNPQAPGWYDDPEDPQQLRYFDGVVWTRHTSRRSTRPAAGPTPPQVPQAPAQQGPAQWPQQPAPPAPQPPYGPAGGWGAPPVPMSYGAPARTPDGEVLAGWWKRLAARVIDWIIVWLVALPFTGYFLYRMGTELSPAVDAYLRELESGNAGAAMPGVTGDMLRWAIGYTVALTLVAIAYEVFFTTRSGATPGKKAMGLRVRLRDVRGPLPVQQALTRTLIPMGGNLLSVIPLVSTLVALLQVADGVLPLVNERKQALHDMMAGTNVVDTRRY